MIKVLIKTAVDETTHEVSLVKEIRVFGLLIWTKTFLPDTNINMDVPHGF